MIYIGLDPAFRKDGFGCCVIDRNKEVAFPVFRTFLDFIFWATDKETHREQAIVCIENSNLQEVTFNMSGSKSVIARKSRNVGKNQAVSQCCVDLCRWAFGQEYVFEVSPREKGKKWTHKQVVQVMKQEKHTCLKKRTNEDERDAYKLATIAKRKAMYFLKRKAS